MKIVSQKRNIKHYFFINYLLYQYKEKTITLSISNRISDDNVHLLYSSRYKNISYDFNERKVNDKNLMKIDDGLYVSKEIYKDYKEHFKNENLIVNFSKFVTVVNYDFIKRKLIHE